MPITPLTLRIHCGAETHETPFFRLTVLGSENVGKTCLINSWVNNYCPTTYAPTYDPTLYYRTVRIQNPDPDPKSEPIIRVLVEIEDTYHWNRQTGKDESQKDEFGKLYRSSKFLDTTKVAKPHDDSVSGDHFAGFEVPTIEDYKPLTLGRMGYLVVFDAHSQSSRAVAIGICDDIIKDQDAESQQKKVKLFLIANKIDKSPWSFTLAENIKKAKEEAAKRQIPFMEVSATEFTRVRKMFRQILEDISTEPSIWKLELNTPEDGTVGITGISPDGNCSVQ